MSDLWQFSNKPLSSIESPISNMLTQELSKSGFDYALESMKKFTWSLSWSSNKFLLKNQISQSLDDYESALQQVRA